MEGGKHNRQSFSETAGSSETAGTSFAIGRPHRLSRLGHATVVADRRGSVVADDGSCIGRWLSQVPVRPSRRLVRQRRTLVRPR